MTRYPPAAVTPPSGSRTTASSAVVLRVRSAEALDAGEGIVEDDTPSAASPSSSPGDGDGDGDEVDPDSRKAAQIFA